MTTVCVYVFVCVQWKQENTTSNDSKLIERSAANFVTCQCRIVLNYIYLIIVLIKLIIFHESRVKCLALILLIVIYDILDPF